jgi:hypothetical protein
MNLSKSFATKLVSSLVVALALGTAACAANTSPEGAERSDQALAPGGGSLGYSCDGIYCTCTGDDDCNNMFSDGVCGEGPKSAICQINSADVPRCRCSVASAPAPSGTTTHVPRPPIVLPPIVGGIAK